MARTVSVRVVGGGGDGRRRRARLERHDAQPERRQVAAHTRAGAATRPVAGRARRSASARRSRRAPRPSGRRGERAPSATRRCSSTSAAAVTANGCGFTIAIASCSAKSAWVRRRATAPRRQQRASELVDARAGASAISRCTSSIEQPQIESCGLALQEQPPRVCQRLAPIDACSADAGAARRTARRSAPAAPRPRRDRASASCAPTACRRAPAPSASPAAARPRRPAAPPRRRARARARRRARAMACSRSTSGSRTAERGQQRRHRRAPPAGGRCRSSTRAPTRGSAAAPCRDRRAAARAPCPRRCRARARCRSRPAGTGTSTSAAVGRAPAPLAARRRVADAAPHHRRLDPEAAQDARHLRDVPERVGQVADGHRPTEAARRAQPLGRGCARSTRRRRGTRPAARTTARCRCARRRCAPASAAPSDGAARARRRGTPSARRA